MKKVLWVILIGVAVFAFAGCMTAGPFVMGISSDGRGNLILQKGYVRYNAWWGTLENKEADSSTIRLFPDK